MKISVVINTLNEEKNIERAIKSVEWADEVIVCDMHSEDETVKIARQFGAKVIYHKKEGFVEPARNFAIAKASNAWILVLDADEEIPDSLVKKLKSIANEGQVDFVQIPRKSTIFGKWMHASMWWPDLNTRFFRKGKAVWSGQIHRPPKTSGKGLTLPTDESMAIIHYHYKSVSQFIERLNEYTTIQARELKNSGYNFAWQDLITKPTNEFLGRFFAGRGFEDGLHGLALGLLQAFSFLIVYLKTWEIEGFKKQQINLTDLEKQVKISAKDVKYWFKYSDLSAGSFKSLLKRIKNKFV